PRPSPFPQNRRGRLKHQLPQQRPCRSSVRRIQAQWTRSRPRHVSHGRLHRIEKYLRRGKLTLPMKLQQLKAQVRSGAIDTVLVALPDPFGRLVGKRFRADVFLDSIAKHGTHGCNYLLTVNMEMDPLDGFKVASWRAGFGDFVLRPDLNTLRVLPWQPGTALVFCDHVRHDG